MKNLALFISLIFVSSLNGQINKFKITGISSCDFINGSWTEWSKLVEKNGVITINSKELRIKVSTAKGNTIFDIIKYKEDVDNVGEKVLIFGCVDENGNDVDLRLRKNDFIVNYDEVMIFYSTYPLD